MYEAVRAFVTSVKLTQCRVFNTPRLVFLCGGAVRRDSRQYKSARDYFHRYLGKNHQALVERVRLAEVVNNWFDKDVFSDLLELEEYIADLADLIVLFVESPGSCAELGAFATADQLRSKTLAVVNSGFKKSGSFIADGPLRRLAKQNSVLYFDWNPTKINGRESLEALLDMSEELVQFLKERERKAVTEEQLNSKSHAHMMLLIADLR